MQISVQSFLVWSSKTPPPFIARWGQWNNGRILGPLTDSSCVLRAGSNLDKAHWPQRHWWCALLRSSPAPTLTHSHHPQSWVKLVVICIIFPVLVTIFTDLCVPVHPGFNESFQHLNWASETVPKSFGDWRLTIEPPARRTFNHRLLQLSKVFSLSHFVPHVLLLWVHSTKRSFRNYTNGDASLKHIDSIQCSMYWI